jgi:hypothetical protein
MSTLNVCKDYFMSLRVISGAQTGADVAGLWAAKHFGIPTGGLAPHSFRTVNGNHPEMAETFGIREHWSSGYRERTIENLKSSNITLVLSEDMNSAGTKLTLNQCKKFEITHFPLKFDPSDMEGCLNNFDANWVISGIKSRYERHKFLTDHSYIINIAGNATNNSPRIFEFTYKFCHRLFTKLGFTSSVPVEDCKKYKDTWK